MSTSLLKSGLQQIGGGPILKLCRVILGSVQQILHNVNKRACLAGSEVLSLLCREVCCLCPERIFLIRETGEWAQQPHFLTQVYFQTSYVLT